MQAYRCGECEQLVFFDNSTCLRCGSPLGFLPDAFRLATLTYDDGGAIDVDGEAYRHCANRHVARCNWLVPDDDPESLCASCRLTSIRPNDAETDALVAFADAETAKRRLLHQLTSLGLPVVDRNDDPDGGLTFEFLSARGRSVSTGHQGGVITLDLSESDDAHREFVRQQLGEPYRTVLGHLRHEIGHYYWPLLVEADPERLATFRELFGDERESYADALERHYGDDGHGTGPSDWSDDHVSPYATMHPWEDWAETWAHYLHVADGLETAAAFGLTVGDPSRRAAGDGWSSTEYGIGPMIDEWLALTLGLNAMSRSIGQDDLYPFVLTSRVVEKLDFVHQVVLP